MASFGVSFPDDLLEEVDLFANKWRSNRSQAIVRIYLEWKQSQFTQLPLAAATEDSPSTDRQMRRLGSPELPNLESNIPAEAANGDYHLGTGPGDSVGNR